MIGLYEHARQLEIEGSVEFIHNGLLFLIWESESEDGYVVDVFDPYILYESYDNEVPEPIDGGLCTGGPRDAVEFMIDTKKEAS